MSEPDIEMLLKECRSGESQRQVEAIERLLELHAYASVSALIEMLTSPDPVVRCSTAHPLGYLGAADIRTAGEGLMSLLGEPVVFVRSEAVDALGILGYTPAVEQVRYLLLNDPMPLVRASAAETLGDLRDAGALAGLELALGDTDDAVRGYAANSMGILGEPQLLPKLRGFAESERSPAVKAELHGACYRLGAAEDLDALLNLVDAADKGLAGK